MITYPVAIETADLRRTIEDLRWFLQVTKRVEVRQAASWLCTAIDRLLQRAVVPRRRPIEEVAVSVDELLTLVDQLRGLMATAIKHRERHIADRAQVLIDRLLPTSETLSLRADEPPARRRRRTPPKETTVQLYEDITRTTGAPPTFAPIDLDRARLDEILRVAAALNAALRRHGLRVAVVDAAQQPPNERQIAPS